MIGVTTSNEKMDRSIPPSDQSAPRNSDNQPAPTLASSPLDRSASSIPTSMALLIEGWLGSMAMACSRLT